MYAIRKATSTEDEYLSTSKSRSFLEKFKREWKYHHPVSDQQLDAAGVVDIVKGVGFYHGGDVLYTLSNTAGTWHEDCLDAVDYSGMTVNERLFSAGVMAD